MNTIAELCGVRLHLGLQFGVEIEMEGRGLVNDLDGWEAHADGSLRNGIEYVFNGPKKLVKSIALVQGLYHSWEEQKARLEPSYRCSTHVHVNVSDWNVKEVQAAVFAYHLLEDMFLSRIHQDRKDNRFAVSGRFSKELERNPLWEGMPQSVREEEFKYSSLNTATLNKYGTLEFRSLHASKDSAIIVDWLHTLNNFMTNVKEMGSVANVVNAFNNDRSAFAKKLVSTRWCDVERARLDDLDRNYSSLVGILMFTSAGA